MRILSYLIIFFAGCFSVAPHAFADAPKQGDRDEDGMVFLYREPIEIYWNDWAGKHLSREKVYISGEGKTANFNGIMELNCENASSYSWVPTSNSCGRLGMTESELNKEVPSQVISAAFEEFCPKDSRAAKKDLPCYHSNSPCHIERLPMAGIIHVKDLSDFLKDLQSALREDDRKAVASMVRYPLTTYDNGTPIKTYANSEELLVAFDKLFTADVKREVADASIEHVFINDDGASIGGGHIWLDGWIWAGEEMKRGGPIKIKAINPDSGRS